MTLLLSIMSRAVNVTLPNGEPTFGGKDTKGDVTKTPITVVARISASVCWIWRFGEC